MFNPPFFSDILRTNALEQLLNVFRLKEVSLYGEHELQFLGRGDCLSSLFMRGGGRAFLVSSF